MIGAVVVAAGSGARMGGGVPKCMRLLGDHPLYYYSLDALEHTPEVNLAVLVAPTSFVERCRHEVRNWGQEKIRAVVPGGATRADSVVSGLRALGEEVVWAGVHDAARPFATSQLWSQVIEVALRYGGAIAALRAVDTLKSVTEEMVQSTLDRSGIWQAQTPQVFRRDQLLEALAAGLASGESLSDDATAMEERGHPVRVVPSELANFKISTPSDWELALRLLHHRPESR